MIIEGSINNLTSLEERLISGDRFGVALIDTNVFINAFSMCFSQEYMIEDLKRGGCSDSVLEKTVNVRLSQYAYARYLLYNFLPRRVDGHIYLGASTDFMTNELNHILNYSPRIMQEEYSEWKNLMSQANDPCFAFIKTSQTYKLLLDWPAFIGTLSPYQLKLLVFQNKIQDSRNDSDSSRIDKGLLMLAARIHEDTDLRVEIITENLRDFKEEGTRGPPKCYKKLIRIRTPKEFIMNYSRRK